MNLTLWIVQGLLGLAFLATGFMKVGRSKEKISSSMSWAKDFTEPQIKLIGTAELLGAIGLIVPGLTNILPLLTPIAGLALFILMAGAFATHLRLKEAPKGVGAIVLGILSLAVAVGRFFFAPL